MVGDIYDDSHKFAQELCDKEQLTFIHPFDDLEVIAGQGTIAKELVEQLDKIDIIFIPVGGGGLISGIVSFIKNYNNNIKVIGVEPEGTPTLYNSLKYKSRILLTEVDRFADGVAAKQLGVENYNFINLVDDSILVNNDEICAAIKDIYNDTRAVAEPSGALATAGIKKYIENNKISNKNLVAIVSGGNINFDRLRYVSERAELGEGTEAIFAATISEKPGSFLDFCNDLGQHNITEFNYRFADNNNDARIFVGVSMVGKLGEKQQLFNKLQQKFEISDLSDNSIAKTHIRYMVGGRSEVKNEVLYRFEFPEKPGALLSFLKEISGKWNISLFHYRNHGSAYSRVLVGFQATDIIRLELILDKIGYIYHNETGNKAYKYFL